MAGQLAKRATFEWVEYVLGQFNERALSVSIGGQVLFFASTLRKCRGLIHQAHLQMSLMETGSRVERQKTRPDPLSENWHNY